MLSWRCRAHSVPPSAVQAQAMGEHGGKRSLAAMAAGAKEMRQGVTWLRKTPLMGNNLYDSVHKPNKEPIERNPLQKQTRELIQHEDAVDDLFQQARTGTPPEAPCPAPGPELPAWRPP